MATQVQLRRGTTANHAAFTGAAGECTVDTTLNTLRVHDGSTAGGHPLAKLAANTFTADQTITGNLSLSGDITLTGAAKGIIFEGTTADAFESTLLAGEPTADVTITMPVTTTTLAGLAVAQTFTAVQTFSAIPVFSSDISCAGDMILTGAGKGIYFEGTTADASETYLVAGEPTGDRTITLPDETCTLGFRNVPQNSQSDNYTCVIADSGKHIYETGASKTVTIPANASVAYPVGTVIEIVAASNAVTIAITSDTMYLATTGGTGSRTLAARGVAVAIKVDTTVWHISGAGLT